MKQTVLLSAALFLLCAVGCSVTPASAECYPQGLRKDCGFFGITEQQCEAKGCCWHEFADHSPWCFFANSEPPQYIVKSIVNSTVGLQVTLITKNTSSGGHGNDISPVVVQIDFDTNQRLHVKFLDPQNDRWEVPRRFSPLPPPPTTKASDPAYSVVVANPGSVFFLKVIRKSDGDILFDTTASDSFNGLSYADQYLSVTTNLPSDSNIYGLGEHVNPLKLKADMTYTMWNFDTATPPNLNLYGSHPFYMDLRKSGAAHGVFLRNSNGMDVLLHSTSLTYYVIGGVLDFFFFMGPTPEEVVVQYQEIIGRPHLPPYWALGFHQCRYGYPNVGALETVVSTYAAQKIPLDTMWTDIDYMDQYKDFSLDPSNFPKSEMDSFVSKLHHNGQQYVVIVDPGIKTEDGYPAWDDGKQQDVFIKDKNGKIFVGKVWPGSTAFPDFFHPKSMDYWQSEIAKFLDLLPVDGLWIDMNEISNFCNGACDDDDEEEKDADGAKAKMITALNTSVGFDPVNPPYSIHNQGGGAALNIKTLDMDCMHFGSVLEYNAHNLFGLSESIATSNALEKLQKKRSLVISRSTFPGSGSHAGHWTGDNHASWDDLYYSIPGMLNFQMFGVPLVGSDICGFQGSTTQELCGRWMQLGAFYPFSRNHNVKGAPSQEPYVWPTVAAISRTVLGIRYSILPYYYTLFYLANKNTETGVVGGTVTRPLFFEFPADAETVAIDRQFLVGPGLLVSPVLTQGATSVTAYLPAARWFDFYDGTEVTKTGSITLDAPMDHINLHVRGGVTIPRQQPGLTTSASRKNSYNLLVALDKNQTSIGYLYLDDGVSIKPKSSFTTYSTSSNSTATTLTASVADGGFDSTDTPQLDVITVYGVAKGPATATLNMKAFTNFKFDTSLHTLTFSSLATDVASNFVLVWSS